MLYKDGAFLVQRLRRVTSKVRPFWSTGAILGTG